MAEQAKILKLYDQSVLVPNDVYEVGVHEYDVNVFTGSRILATMFVKSLDVGASVQIDILNSFSVEFMSQWENILSFSSSNVGYTKRVITDFNKFFKIRVTVIGGDVELAFAMSVFDNAATTVIENAEIDVNLSDKTSGLKPYDITRIGDGNRELQINLNNEVKVHDQDVKDKLQEVVDAINNDNDTLPTGASTEAKQDIQIDQLDDLLQGQTDQNLLLGDINTELDAQTTALGMLNGKDFATSAKQDLTNNKLDTLNAKDFATSGKQDLTNNKLDTLNAKDFSTSAKQDTTNNKLDTLNAKDFATSAKQDAANTLLSNVLTAVQDNVRQKILKAVDRATSETYVDFGTKNERIVQIDYTAPSVGSGSGFTARKTFSYVLDGNSYRPTTTVWTLI